MKLEINQLPGLRSSQILNPNAGGGVAPAGPAHFSVSIIIPTKNESANIYPLLSAIERATQGISTQLIFVDDSSDDTAQVIRALEARFPMQVELIARPPERRGAGLGGAVVEGIRAARAPWVCVMDGDLQHPPDLIPALLSQAKRTGSDLVIGSRLAPGGDASSLGRRRSAASRAFAAFARAALPAQLHKVTDPLSGLFLVRRSAVNLDRLRPDGFKILLEILARCPELSVSELPFKFGYRHAGESKASIHEVLRFFGLVVRLRLETDPRFVRFMAVGISGLLVNSLALALATEWLGVYYLVSVALASVCSTIWNFALTEQWVFRDRRQTHARLRRFTQFFMINIAALVLRGPMVFVLTSLLGVHYLLSNLLSVGALTMARFLLSDKWIWGKTAPVQPSLESARSERRNAAAGTMIRKSRMVTKSYHYEIHGIVSVSSETPLPELEWFRTDRAIAHPTLLVHVGKYLQDEQRDATPSDVKARRMCYDEGLGSLGFRAQIEIGETIEVWASPLLRLSPHVLYTNLVEPILRWTFVEKGYALVHAACLDFGGAAYLITARTDTGKTTTLLKILSRQRRATDRAAFISDDLTLISPAGKVLTYPKPLTISQHTARAVNARLLSWRQRLALPIQSRVHSRSSRRIAHALGQTRLPMATINALVQFVVPPPKYRVQTLVPGAKQTPEADLAGMFVIERSKIDREVVLSPEQALEILMRNCEDAYGFPPYGAIKEFLYSAHGRDLPGEERAIISRALHGRPSTLLSRSDQEWWRGIPAIVDETLAVHFRQPAPTSSRPRLLRAVDVMGSAWEALMRLGKEQGATPQRRFSDRGRHLDGNFQIENRQAAINRNAAEASAHIAE